MTVIRKQNNIFTPRNTETGGNLHMFKKLWGRRNTSKSNFQT